VFSPGVVCITSARPTGHLGDRAAFTPSAVGDPDDVSASFWQRPGPIPREEGRIDPGAKSDAVHELSIAQSLVESIRAELSARDNPRLVRAGVRVGELSGVHPDALKFSFDVIVQGTELERAELDVEWIPLKYRCRGCLHEFAVEAYETTCPACGSLETTAVAGDELRLSYIELE
jgi:hydrogenase nickel incorporation protein HypA/HybF